MTPLPVTHHDVCIYCGSSSNRPVVADHWFCAACDRWQEPLDKLLKQAHDALVVATDRMDAALALTKAVQG